MHCPRILSFSGFSVTSLGESIGCVLELELYHPDATEATEATVVHARGREEAGELASP